MNDEQTARCRQCNCTDDYRNGVIRGYADALPIPEYSEETND